MVSQFASPAKLRRSLIINFFSSSGAAALQFVVSVLLSRILSPSDIGVFSMTVVFVNIAHIFRDFGVATYLQREPDLTPDKIRAATGVLVTASWTVAFLLYLGSGAFASMLGEPGIAPVMRVLSLGFLLIPFTSVTNALLVRQLAADKEAIVMALGTISFCASCLTFAALGMGSLSLAWANFVNILVSTLALIALRPPGTPWLPSWRRWHGIVHFGIGALLSNFADAVNNAVPDLLLGKLGSARLVGLFSRANSTVTIFTYIAGSTVSYGAVSYLSDAHHRGDSMGPILGRATALLTGIGWPALALTALFGRDLVLALYGNAWLSCVPAILPLAIAAAVAMLFHYSPAALNAMGQPYVAALPLLIMLLCRIGFGVALFDGSLATFGWAICLATCVAAPVMAWQQQRQIGLSSARLLAAVWPSALVTVATAAVAALGEIVLAGIASPLLRLLLLAPPLAAAWYAAVSIVQHPLDKEVRHLASSLAARFRPESLP